MELDDFGVALEALVASDAANQGDGASIEELHHQLSRFESFVTEATAAFEAGEWAADGARTASASGQGQDGLGASLPLKGCTSSSGGRSITAVSLTDVPLW
jgi:hypothetical protein